MIKAPFTRSKISNPGVTSPGFFLFILNFIVMAKNNKGLEKLKKIVAKAKVIRKSHPAKKWTTCIKEASK